MKSRFLNNERTSQHKIGCKDIGGHYAISSCSVDLLRILPLAAVGVTVQCEKQITDVRDSWVKNWNDGELGNVVNLYYSHADLLTADGSRASGKDEIRAALEKQIGSKVEVHGLGLVCNGALAYENGTYTQTANGQSIEGNYLVVLLLGSDGKWLIVQHASTAKR